jgi:hypothetical protein
VVGKGNYETGQAVMVESSEAQSLSFPTNERHCGCAGRGQWRCNARSHLLPTSIQSKSSLKRAANFNCCAQSDREWDGDGDGPFTREREPAIWLAAPSRTEAGQRYPVLGHRQQSSVILL